MATEDSLRNLKIKNTYSSLESGIIEEIIIPLLEKSVLYDRGVGFFTSGWLKKVTPGFLSFVRNKGKARIVTSVHLSEGDWATIKKADQEDQDRLIVESALRCTIDELNKKLEYDTLAALAWLVRDGILEFRFAIPKKELSGGIFHSKLSIFIDAHGDGVVLHGSQNDSIQASLNEESLSAFKSWDTGLDWYHDHRKRFNQLWGNQYPNLKVLKIKEAEKEIIIRHTEYLPCPYTKSNYPKKNEKVPPKKPDFFKTLVLRDYQKEAILEWQKNDRRGIFEMATGTGKTITAISAAVEVYKKENRLALVILVPYIHLVDQWVEDLLKFGFHPTRCYESVNKWKLDVGNKIREFNAKLSDHICLVSTHQTSSMPTFRKMISRLHEPLLLIGDEIHELGSVSYSKALADKATWRIGLSATPDRWYDEEGTQIIRDYFGKTVIQYELRKAIKENALTPYHYYPEKIDLDEEEIEEYLYISKIIAQEYGKKAKDQSKIENYLRKRADLIGRANNKIPQLLKILAKHKNESESNGQKFQHILLYCNKGTHLEVLSAVADMGLKIHEFVHDVPLKNRKKILTAFSNGEIDGLVAIRCLDQGVDVPATRRAYILASSTNPREFVQRRGRILRKSNGKQFAVVHDFMVGPWKTIDSLGKETAKKLLLRELPRFAEFSLDAQNSQEARNQIWDSIETLDLISSIRKRPWDVYKELHNENKEFIK
ncbi:MAG: DEAD/DEAH box helicase family protein [Deltaproteobacteria bacterium]|jgi:superfamily II DNA or RNA helicase|nr:DEAD/DEAH box helicase family protein [Deltaproteobacteria bacterium]